jgi:hypothetical protein
MDTNHQYRRYTDRIERVDPTLCETEFKVTRCCANLLGFGLGFFGIIVLGLGILTG